MVMVIDTHTHIAPRLPGKPYAHFPKQKVDLTYKVFTAMMGEERFKEWLSKIDWSAEALIKDMDEAGIDKSIAMALDYSVICRQEPEISVWKLNEYTAEMQAKYPDRIIGFAGVDPRRSDAIELVEKAVKEWGLKGVKIAPNHYYLTDSEVQPYLTKVNNLGVPLTVHVGSDPLPYLIEHGNPKDISTLLLRYPNMTINAAHCAQGYEDVLVELMKWHKGRVYADISAHQHELVNSPWHFNMFLRYYMDIAPQAVMMGSDWPSLKSAPLPSHKEWFDAIRNLKLPPVALELGMKDFTQEERDMILGENAIAFCETNKRSE